MKKRTNWKKRLAIILTCLTLIIIGFVGYVNNGYIAKETALQALQSDEEVKIQELENDNIVFHQEGNTTGLIFYPGGKVEHRAYAPLLRELAENGITCILVKMPFQLAVLDVNAADGILEQFPEIRQWYIGGHSLGGSMAATYASKHDTEFAGVMLFAAYSTSDLSETSLKVFSTYGSQDGVLNLEKYEAYKKNLPKDYMELVIKGGNHAGFGDYGTEKTSGQKGDGESLISSKEQIEQTVAWILQNLL